MSKTWTPIGERRLLDFRDEQNLPWAQVATNLARSQSACQQRYAKLREARASNLVTWTTSLDQRLIDAKGRGLSPQAIAAELDIPVKAVPGRWNELKSEGRVPDEMVGEQAHKEVEPWTHDEDVQILEMWNAMKDDREIREKGTFKQKRSMKEVGKRRVWLVYHGLPGDDT